MELFLIMVGIAVYHTMRSVEKPEPSLLPASQQGNLQKWR